jgi:hypothetical protein
MTPPTPQEAEIAGVAASLSKAQREAILSAQDIMSNHGGYPFLAATVTSDPWPAGIAEFLTLKSDRLTPLGLQVRAYLQMEKEQAT